MPPPPVTFQKLSLSRSEKKNHSLYIDTLVTHSYSQVMAVMQRRANYHLHQHTNTQDFRSPIPFLSASKQRQSNVFIVFIFCIRPSSHISYLCPRPVRAEALSEAFVWRLTSVCLSVAYIGNNSRTERPVKTKIGTQVEHVTHDSNTTFKVNRSKVKVTVTRPLWLAVQVTA